MPIKKKANQKKPKSNQYTIPIASFIKAYEKYFMFTMNLFYSNLGNHMLLIRGMLKKKNREFTDVFRDTIKCIYS